MSQLSHDRVMGRRVPSIGVRVSVEVGTCARGMRPVKVRNTRVWFGLVKLLFIVLEEGKRDSKFHGIPQQQEEKQILFFLLPGLARREVMGGTECWAKEDVRNKRIKTKQE